MRYRRAALTAITAATGKIVSLAVQILTVRLTFRYLGAERYGMWVTITSFVMMLGFADFGMGNGLVNLVADASGREDRHTAKEAVASAFWMLSGVGLMLALIAIFLAPRVNLVWLFNVHSEVAAREAGPALLIFTLCFLLNLPLGAVQSTQTGMQNASSNNLWNILGTILSLIAMLGAIHFHAGLPLLVLALSGPQVLASVLNGVKLFGFSHKYLFPAPRAFSRETALRLLRTGMMFFLLQLSFSIGLQTDNIVIARVMGAQAVADYAVPARLFNMILGFLVMISSAMFPAYTEALARSDGQWIRKSFLRITIAGTVVTVIAVGVLILCGNQILHAWVDSQMHASTMLLTALGAQTVLYAYLQPISFLLNGIGQFRAQVISGLMMAVLNLALSILFVKNFGVIGAVFGTIGALILVQVAPLTIVVRRELKRLIGISDRTEAVAR